MHTLYTKSVDNSRPFEVIALLSQGLGGNRAGGAEPAPTAHHHRAYRSVHSGSTAYVQRLVPDKKTRSPVVRPRTVLFGKGILFRFGKLYPFGVIGTALILPIIITKQNAQIILPGINNSGDINSTVFNLIQSNVIAAQ